MIYTQYSNSKNFPIKRIIKNLISRKSPAIKSKFRLEKSVLNCCIAYNKYGSYCVPLSSYLRPSAQAVLSGHIWEPQTIEYINKNRGSGDIVHAGTYFGDFLPALSQYSKTDSKIWAFEPNPESYRCAQITSYVNELKNVELMNAGLGAIPGNVCMAIAEMNGQSLGGASHFIENHENLLQDNHILVPVVTVDDVINSDRYISVIQLDVEGFEQEALNGALLTIRRCKPILMLETLPELTWLSNNIFNLGYKIVGKVHQNHILKTD